MIHCLVAFQTFSLRIFFKLLHKWQTLEDKIHTLVAIFYLNPVKKRDIGRSVCVHVSVTHSDESRFFSP